MPLQPGQTISHYRIDQQIGEGGMGVVYLAEDTRLGRRIALKVLPAEMSADPARRARFEREARAIAALNHPNIVTLHSVEEADGVSFLTMELVDGLRLTQMLSREGLALQKLLDLSVGIASALVAAHRQGVVHRDLKPDNIMVTADGRIKVLDFGLAKLRESALEGAGTALPTTSITEEGKILGTVSYMSPEQAEGKPLDHRSDIFSFGVVLYEMSTGRRPFRGDTAISTISSILKDAPPPLLQINTALPPHLGRIVRRCLSKEPERRYQSTDDLCNELRELKEESESGEMTLERPAVTGSSPGRAGGAATSKRPVVIALLSVLLVAAAVAGWLWMRREAPRGPAPGMQAQIQMIRATTDGKVQEVAISPDGRYLAYVRLEKAVFSLRLRQVVTGDEVQVVAPSEANLTSPSFSSDGNFLRYVSIDPGRFSGWVYQVSVLGGTPRRIVDGARSVAASPDDRTLALAGGTFEQSYVRVVGADGDAPRDLVLRKGRDHFDFGAKWSSDAKSLAIVSHRFGEAQQIVLIDPATGVEQALPISTLHSFDDLTWVPGQRALLVAGSERPVNQRASSQVWEVSMKGELQALTRDLNSYSGLTVTADGSTVAAVQEEWRSGIDVAPVRDGMPGEFTELFPISASRPGFAGIAWIAGDRLAHSMMQADVQQVFVTDLSTRASRALTAGPSHHDPGVSRDGRAMVVVRDEGDGSNLWRLDPETGRVQRLTDGKFDLLPILDADGSWVVYASAMETIKLLKIPGTGGTPVEMTKRPAACAGISADNRDALCLVFGPSGEPESAFIPLSGGEPRPIPGLPAAVKLVRFGPDGRSISYLISREGADELWSLPAPGGAPRRLVRFEGKEIAEFAWSADGAHLAVVKVSRSGDVVLLKRSSS